MPDPGSIHHSLTSPESTTPSSNQGQSSTTSSASSPNVGAIVGGVIGGLAFLSVLGGLFLWFRRRRRNSWNVDRFHVDEAEPKPNPRFSVEEVLHPNTRHERFALPVAQDVGSSSSMSPISYQDHSAISSESLRTSSIPLAVTVENLRQPMNLDEGQDAGLSRPRVSLDFVDMVSSNDRPSSVGATANLSVSDINSVLRHRATLIDAPQSVVGSSFSDVDVLSIQPSSRGTLTGTSVSRSGRGSRMTQRSTTSRSRAMLAKQTLVNEQLRQEVDDLRRDMERIRVEREEQLRVGVNPSARAVVEIEPPPSYF